MMNKQFKFSGLSIAGSGEESENSLLSLTTTNSRTHLTPHSSSSMLRQGAPPSVHASTPTSLQQESIGLLLMRNTHARTHAVCVFVAGGCDGSIWSFCFVLSIAVIG